MYVPSTDDDDDDDVFYASLLISPVVAILMAAASSGAYRSRLSVLGIYHIIILYLTGWRPFNLIGMVHTYVQLLYFHNLPLLEYDTPYRR